MCVSKCLTKMFACKCVYRIKVQSKIRGRYHGGWRPSSDDSFHSLTVILPSALDKPSIMKRYHRQRACSHISPHRPPMMVTQYDTCFVEWWWWNDSWAVKTVVTLRSSASMIPAPGLPTAMCYAHTKNAMVTLRTINLIFFPHLETCVLD